MVLQVIHLSLWNLSLIAFLKFKGGHFYMNNTDQVLEKFDSLRKDPVFRELIRVETSLEQLKELLNRGTEIASEHYFKQNEIGKMYASGYKDALLFIKDAIDEQISIMNATICSMLGVPEETWDTMCENTNNLMEELEKNNVSEEIFIGAVKCSIAKHLNSINV